MNLFEDLVEELKDENLLEETFIETNGLENQSLSGRSPQVKSSREDFQFQVSNEILTPSPILAPPVQNDIAGFDLAFDEEYAAGPLTPEDLHSAPILARNDEVITDQKVEEPIKKSPINESEYFRRRATEEVSSLKIVEHVISGVEREHMKIFPKTYDDVAVSVALHDFLKITLETQSPEHAQAEFKLMQETESWYSSLSYRDKHISVGDLRRYCEGSRPPLSAQALISLARFYRNSPFSELVRSKFDMIVTRLLSREIEDHKREVLFDRDELIQQLTGLYADWSSIPLYAADDDPEVLIAALKFEDFVGEVSKADTFEELVRNDFFNRLRIFKESTGENFFSPLLTATAVESNITIGNYYVDLVGKEREKESISEIDEKYKSLLDQVVSDSTSKTLQLIDLLKEKQITPVHNLTEEKETLNLESEKIKSTNLEKRTKTSFLNVNKWIIAFGVFAVLFCAGLYVWVEYLTPQAKPSSSVKTADLDQSPLKEFIPVAKINNGMFYGITNAAWAALPKEAKEDVLKKALEVGAEKGYTKVQLINPEGKPVGFASAEHGIDLTQAP